MPGWKENGYTYADYLSWDERGCIGAPEMIVEMLSPSSITDCADICAGRWALCSKGDWHSRGRCQSEYAGWVFH